MKQCTPSDVLQGKTPSNAQHIDVRETSEYASQSWKLFQSMPLSGLQHSVQSLDKSRPVIVMCLSGGRSMNASAFLDAQGFQVWNVQGGISAAAREGAPIERGESAGLFGALKGMFS